METRIKMIEAGFIDRYSGRKSFLNEPGTKELLKILLRRENVENIFRLCIAGQQPLKAVVYEIEEFADKNKIKVTDTWKQNVGMLIGTIVHFLGYVSNEEKSLQDTPKYFKNASTFRKE